MSLTIAIPTYGRGAIVVETIERLLALPTPANAILIVDQTAQHPTGVTARLTEWDRTHAIQWIRLPKPSIPGAMNHALRAATTDLVLFLDDDIIPNSDLVAAHTRAHAAHGVAAVVGQILQPNEKPEPIDRASDRDLDFAFHSSIGRRTTNVMAGNLSVNRETALRIGGFDENFIAAAYRFETDFAWRLIAAGASIWYEPAASIHHLKASTGGLRTWGDHLRSASPAHSVGDYYLALLHFSRGGVLRHVARRLRQTILTKFDLTHPWWIPVKAIRETRALLQAIGLRRRGRRLLA
jgi:GT2 family glycosyltransferase